MTEIRAEAGGKLFVFEELVTTLAPAVEWQMPVLQVKSVSDARKKPTHIRDAGTSYSRKLARKIMLDVAVGATVLGVAV